MYEIFSFVRVITIDNNSLSVKIKTRRDGRIQ